MTFIIFLLSIFLLNPINAQAIEKTHIKQIKAIESYLNNITTLKANFIQTNNSGEKKTGIFLLKRPGRLRFEYKNTKFKDFIVADGSYIHYYDAEMKQRSSTSIDNSLASFFLSENIDFFKDVKISEFKIEKNLFKIKILQKNKPLAGVLTLFLNKKPIKLKYWEIIDSYGLRTKIELKNIELGKKLDNNLFYYYDPERKKLFINK